MRELKSTPKSLFVAMLKRKNGQTLNWGEHTIIIGKEAFGLSNSQATRATSQSFSHKLCTATAEEHLTVSFRVPLPIE